MISGKRYLDWTIREFSREINVAATKDEVSEKSNLLHIKYIIRGSIIPAIIGIILSPTRLIGRELPIDDQLTINWSR
jgi:hypothetical protein